METITKTAFAKINLGLDVTGRRPDGYHLVDMIMQSITLSDTLVITGSGERKNGAGTTSLIMENGPEGLSLGEDNLICRAVKACRENFPAETPIPEHVEIRLTKHIPMAAGMAGGSTDAAAVFTGLRDLYAPGLSDEELCRMALPLGADIPFCIGGGTKRARGIGEELEELPEAPVCALVYAKPDFGVSTPWVYKTLDLQTESGKEVRHPDIEGIAEAIRRGNRAKMLALAGNVLEPVTAGTYGLVKDIENYFAERGAMLSLMTGSGPTVFAVFEDEIRAESEARRFAADRRFAGCCCGTARFSGCGSSTL